MTTPNSPTPRERPSVAPVRATRRPRYVLGTFWLIVAVLIVVGAIAGRHWWLIVIGIAAFVYAIYLYRGGRHGFWFF